MITTKPVLVKFDFAVNEKLNMEAATGHDRKNRIVNKAVDYYIDMLDRKRENLLNLQEKNPGYTEDAARLGQYILIHLGSQKLSELKHIAMGIDASYEEVATMFLEHALDDYNKRPFSYF